MTGRFLKLPADDSVPARVKVGGIELPQSCIGESPSWHLCHGGWLYIECEKPNAQVKVKLTNGKVVEYGDEP
jgi:hypothetical protein